MIKAGYAQQSENLSTAIARCGLDVQNKWWRGNWWRLTPPAVPFASAWGTDS